MLNWIMKWFYYVPNAYKELKVEEWIKSRKKLPEGIRMVFHRRPDCHVEHLAWPHLSVLQDWCRAQRPRAICEKHGVPYLRGNIFERAVETMDDVVRNTFPRSTSR